MSVPVAVWSGTFRLCGVDLKCAVLDSGQRVIEAESIEALLDAMAGDVEIDQAEMLAFARWQKGINPEDAS